MNLGPTITTAKRGRPCGERPAPIRVLVADDDAEVRAAITEVLASEGCDVISVANGSAALEALAQAADGAAPAFDVVVLDFVMPGFSGVGILGLLRRFGRVPPAILVTAFPDPSLDALARRFGALHVLRKPIDVDELSSLVLECARRAPPHERGA